MNLLKSSPFKISSLIFLFIVSLCPSVFAGAPDTLWTRTYGGAGGEYLGNSVQETSDGGFIIVGKGFVSEDLYILKTDENGDTLWTNIIGRTYNDDHGNCVKQTADGDYIITGYTESYGTSGSTFWLIKIDSNGDSLWSKTYGSGEGYSVCLVNDGGYIIAGKTLSDAGDEDVYLVRTDNVGDTIWTRTFGGSDHDNGHAVLQTNDGGFVIAGGTASFNPGGGDVYLIRTDSNGDTLWTRIYGGTDSDWGYSLQQTNDGGYIIAGNTWSFSRMVDIYLVKTDKNGDSLWTKFYGNHYWERAHSICALKEGGYIISGEMFPENGEQKVYLIRTNAHGDTLWTQEYGNGHENEGHSIQQTSDGGFIITGYTYGMDTNNTHGVYLIRLGKDSTGIQKDKQKNFLNQNDLIIIGDTRNNLISIRYTIQHSSSVKLSMYNISGQLVKTVFSEHKNRGEYSEQIKTDNISSGVYYVTLEAGERRYTRKSVVVE